MNLEDLGLEFTGCDGKGLRHLPTLRQLREIGLMGSEISGPDLRTSLDGRSSNPSVLSDTRIHSEDLRWLVRFAESENPLPVTHAHR